MKKIYKHIVKREDLMIQNLLEELGKNWPFYMHLLLEHIRHYFYSSHHCHDFGFGYRSVHHTEAKIG